MLISTRDGTIGTIDTIVTIRGRDVRGRETAAFIVRDGVETFAWVEDRIG
jgi:hypothetical protein